MNSPHKDTVLIAALPEIENSPSPPLGGRYSAKEIEELNISFLADSICQFNRQTRARTVVFVNHPSEREALENYFLSAVDCREASVLERGTLLGSAIEWGFREEQCRNLFLLLAPHPLVCSSIIEHSLNLLTIEDETVVYGAMCDGAPYLLGMTMPHPALTALADGDFFDGEILLRQCCATESGVHTLPTIPAIRSFADLMALKTKIEELCEARGEYPKKSLTYLRQLDNSKSIKVQ